MNKLEQAAQRSTGSIRVSQTAKGHEIPQKSPAIATIFWAGLACGILDISAALVTWGLRGVHPVRLLQAIASGLLGAKAFDGGWQTAFLGVACHFLIAFSVSTVYYGASRKLEFMTQHATFSGVSYGIAVYVVMYWMVMPFSHLQQTPFSPARTLIAIVTHMLCVGLPIAVIVRRFSMPANAKLGHSRAA
jgi:hypothetical protein